MKVTATNNVTVVTLSTKNLLDLLAQVVEGRDSVSLVRQYEAGVLYVTVEPNDVHYADRAAGPGSGLVS
jgi:hypothetical protein